MNNLNLSKKLSAMAKLVPMPFYCLDLDQRYVAVNRQGLKELSSDEDHLLGKYPKDFYPKDLADNIIKHNKLAIESGNEVQLEGLIESDQGTRKKYIITIAPLYDDQENTLVGTSIALTHNTLAVEQPRQNSPIKPAQQQRSKSAARASMFKRLEDIAEVIPAPFFWTDLNHVFLGVNSIGLKEVGLGSDCPEKIIGSTMYNIYPKELADELTGNHRQVIATGKPLRKQEVIRNITTGKLQHYEATLAPLHDDEDNIIGLYGISINITAQKEAERLRQESEIKQAQLVQQEKFSQVISQAVHDIRSPLVSMKMILKTCAELPTPTRLALQEAATSIDDIAENLLQNWRPSQDGQAPDIEEKTEPVLVSLLLMQVLASKRFQFQDTNIKFSHQINQADYFACIKANSSRFKRMLSNIINNAVAAYEDKDGQIICTLESKNNQVLISIQDQGKGIPADVLKKIRAGIAVTSGKKDGHGLGLTQVRDTITLFQGKLAIDSVVRKGTKVQLNFPRSRLAPWLADSVTINADDTLVVLDDEESMHQAWKEYFKQSDCYQHFSQHSVHFTQGQAAVDYINGAEDKDKLFLLTDYELLKQPLNGVDVIKRTGLRRVIVVTSHHDDKQLRGYIINAGIKLLPKQLAWQVPINIKAQIATAKAVHKARIVILDDDRNFTSSFDLFFAEPDKPIDAYNQPDELLKNLPGYNKDTKFYLDHNLSCEVSGLDIAQQLYAAGYTRLFLLSGQKPKEGTLPAYVTFIDKRDLTSIEI
jgi:PAS domain S-box-containing protein